MKKKQLQHLVDIHDTNKDIVAVDGKTLRVEMDGKTLERTVTDEAGVSQAIQELQTEADNYGFLKGAGVKANEDDVLEEDDK